MNYMLNMIIGCMVILIMDMSYIVVVKLLSIFLLLVLVILSSLILLVLDLVNVLDIDEGVIFVKRTKLSRRSSKKIFKKGARKVKAVNIAPTPMRGGFRL